MYEFGNAQKSVVYIGSSSAIKSRMRRHLSGDVACINTHAKYYRVDYRGDYEAESGGPGAGPVGTISSAAVRGPGSPALRTRTTLRARPFRRP